MGLEDSDKLRGRMHCQYVDRRLILACLQISLRGEQASSYWPAVTLLAARVVNWLTALIAGSEMPFACIEDTL